MPNGLALSDHARAEQVGLDFRMTLLTLGSPGLRAGKSPDFLVLRGLARSGRSRVKVAGARILSKNVANARSACSGKSRDGVRRGGQGVREADLVRGDPRGGRPDPGDLADGLVDGQRRSRLDSHTRPDSAVGPRLGSSECLLRSRRSCRPIPYVVHRAGQPRRLKRSAGQPRCAELDDLYASASHGS